MPKLLAIGTTLKGILMTASFAFVRGDMLPVILISILFNLVHLSAKPFGQAVQKDTIVISAGHEPPRGN